MATFTHILVLHIYVCFWIWVLREAERVNITHDIENDK